MTGNLNVTTLTCRNLKIKIRINKRSTVIVQHKKYTIQIDLDENIENKNKE